jgi:histidyl-tRNA synthetase
MIQEIKETCYKGTRILLGNEKRLLINSLIDCSINEGFQEISIPIIQFQETFKDKVGKENNNLMFNFIDRGSRNICLAPEYTAIIQMLSKTTFKYKKDIKLFYIQECFRGENPQAGRYRQFTQFGIEIINPSFSIEYIDYLSGLAMKMLNNLSNKEFKLNLNVTRGLDYYKDGNGFEVICEELRSSKQICGGGEYDGGIGFAIGVDRLLKLIK